MRTKMRKCILTMGMLLMAICGYAQPQPEYYTAATLDGKSGRALELALRDIVREHERIRYDSLWSCFPITDPGPVDSIPSTYTGGKTDLVYDMYAWMGQFTKFYSDNNHTQQGGFNREHCVPNSWWGGKAGNTYAYSDLHHLMPADGAANSVAKNDYPLGEYTDGLSLGWPVADKTNTAGYTYVTRENPCSRRWDVPASMREQFGGATSLFEPTDEYKGDFARAYFYVVCTYEGEMTWRTNYMFLNDDQSYTEILPWAKELLLKWHRQDPISDKERARNNSVEGLQQNRNPFIDYPELVEYIWGDKSTDNDFTLADAISAYSDEYTGNESGGDDNTGDDNNPDPEGTFAYYRIQEQDDITLGEVYLIVCESESTAMGSQTTSRRNNAPIEITDGAICTDKVNEEGYPYEITLGTEEGYYTMLLSNGQFLGNGAKGSNSLKGVKNYAAGYGWTLTYELDGTVTMMTNHAETPRYLCVNTTNTADSYATYTSLAKSYKPVTLYKKTKIADAIPELMADSNAEPIYNLAGQRVRKPSKGVYIKGGKRILVSG